MKTKITPRRPKILKQLSPERHASTSIDSKITERLPVIGEDIVLAARQHFIAIGIEIPNDFVVAARHLNPREVQDLQAHVRDCRLRTDISLQTMTKMKCSLICKQKAVEKIELDIENIEQRIEELEKPKRPPIFITNGNGEETCEEEAADILLKCELLKAQLLPKFDRLMQEINNQASLLQLGMNAKKLICQAIFAIKTRSFKHFLSTRSFDQEKLSKTVHFCRDIVRAIISINEFDIGRSEQLLTIFREENLIRGSSEIENTHKLVELAQTQGLQVEDPLCIIKTASEMTVPALIADIVITNDHLGQVISSLKASYCPEFICTERHYEALHRYIKYMQEQTIMHIEKAQEFTMMARNDEEEDVILRIEDNLKVCELKQLAEGFQSKIIEARSRINALQEDKACKALPIEKFSDEMLADERNAIHIYEAEYDGLSREQIKYEYESLECDILRTVILNNLTKNRFQILYKEASVSQIESVELILKQTDDLLRETTEEFLQIKDNLAIQNAKRIVFQENSEILHEIKMSELANEELQEERPQRKKVKKPTAAKQMNRTWLDQKTQTVRNLAIREAVQSESRMVENDYYK